MTRRLVPLVVALAIALAPAAREACQVECALHAVTAATASTGPQHTEHSSAAPAAHPAGHSCHGFDAAVPQPGGTTIKGLPHRCGHSNDLPAFSGTVIKAGLAVPAVIPAAFEFPPALERPHRSNALAPSLPASRIALVAQLRV